MIHKNDNKLYPEKSSKRYSLGVRIIKYLSVGIGSIILLLCIFVAWIYFAIISGPDPMDTSKFHPFRSEKAKIEYMTFEKEMEKTWPIASGERFVTTSFGNTFMRISGPLNAPPLLLLPGGGTNSVIWNANIEALSKEYRTYALDNIYDYGRSVYMRKIETGKDYSDWLDELADSLNLADDIRVMGYSYGGWVASQYAIQHPERIAKLVLIGPASTILPIPSEYIVQMLQSIIPIRYFKSKIMYWVWADLANMGEWGIGLVEARIDYFQLALKSFKFKQSVNPIVLTDEEIKGIRFPLLHMVGENETAYNAKDAVARLKDLNSDILTVILDGTGHDLMFTHTDTVNNILLEFLQE